VERRKLVAEAAHAGRTVQQHLHDLLGISHRTVESYLAIAFSNHFWQLVVCRLLISCVGAGFVVGIRLVGEWFDAREIGLAEGIYGGLGNFGMAAATFGLPLLALIWPGENGWRFAMLVSARAIQGAFVPTGHRPAFLEAFANDGIHVPKEIFVAQTA